MKLRICAVISGLTLLIVSFPSFILPTLLNITLVYQNRHKKVPDSISLLYFLCYTIHTLFNLDFVKSALSCSTFLCLYLSAPSNPNNFDDMTVLGIMRMQFLGNLKEIPGKLFQLGIPEDLNTLTAFNSFQNTLNKLKSPNRVIYALLLSNLRAVLLNLLLTTLSDLLLYTSPLILSRFLRQLSNGSTLQAYKYALLVCLVKLLSTLVSGIKQVISVKLLLKARCSLMESIYRKSMHSKDNSKIMNLLSVDTAMVQRSYAKFINLFSTVVNLIISLLQLHFFIGSSVFACVPLYILYVGFSSWATKKKVKKFPEMMQARDLRAKHTFTGLKNILSLKMYAWEDPYEVKINAARNHELEITKKYLKIDVLFESLTSQLDSLGLVCVFVYFLATTNKELTPELVFPVLSLMTLISKPLFAFPRSITSLASAFVSQSRINELLLMEEVDNKLYFHNKYEKPEVLAKNVHLGYPNKPLIRDFNLHLQEHDLCVIIGRVGTGKTSLLRAICGQLPLKSGELHVNGTIAYANQDLWLQFQTIKENILFGREFHPEFYEKVVKMCCLDKEISELPLKDETKIGEKGISLSGGQKSRLCLARAVYSNPSVLVLDDVLAAVDRNVANKLLTMFKQLSCIIVIASNNEDLVKLATKVVCLDSNEVAVRSIARQCSAWEGPELALTEPVVNVRPTEYNPSPVFRIFRKYLTLNGKYTYLAIFLLVCAVLTENSVAVYLSILSNKHLSGLQTSQKYIFVFILLIFFSVLLFALSFFMNLGVLSLSASKQIHDQMITHVLHTKMMFFESNSLGTIMNRFQGDLNSVDSSLPSMVHTFLRTICSLALTISVSLVSAPFLVFVLVPLFYKYQTYAKIYVPVSKHLQKLTSSLRGPILSHIEESIQGIEIINSFDLNERFVDIFRLKCDKWMHVMFLKSCLRRWLNYKVALLSALVMGSSALSMVFLTSYCDLPVSWAGFVVLSVQRGGRWLSYIISSYSDLEINLVSLERTLEYTNLESEGVYRLPGEPIPGEPVPGEPIPGEPMGEMVGFTKGDIEFKDLTAQYRPELPPTLKNVNFTVKRGEKIGIIGRTGSGKSTIVRALLRLCEINGDVLFNKVKSTDLGLQNLRSHISIIPQETQIFQGTLKSNLDPFNQYTDEMLNSVLQMCHLTDHFMSLDVEINDQGSNISRGQAQLICLARALLTNSDILVLDEATSHVDLETDEFVQRTIRERFKDRTVLTIAHRVNTIVDSDRFLEVQNGVVHEVPRVL